MRKIKLLLLLLFLILFLQTNASAVNLLASLNNGFEDSLTNWTAINPSYVNITDTPNAYSGLKACRLGGLLTTAKIGIASSILNVLPNEEYVFSAYLLLSATNEEADVSDVYVELQIVAIYADGSKTETTTVDLSLNDLNIWEEIEATESYIVPDGVFQVMIVLNAWKESGVTFTYNLFVDDVAFDGPVSNDNTPPSLVSNVNATADFGQATVTWDLNEIDNDIYLYRVFYSNDYFTNVDNATLAGGVYHWQNVNYLTFDVTNEGTHYFAVTAMDTAGNENKNITPTNVYILSPGGLLTTDDHDWSFEGDGTKWTYTATGATFGDSARKKHGLKSLKYSSLTGTPSGRLVASSFVDIDTNYEYSAYIWFNSSSEAFNEARIKIGVEWYNAANNLISETAQSDAQGFQATARDIWEKVNFEKLEAPDNATKAKVKFYIWRPLGGASRTINIDAAKFIGTLKDTSPKIFITVPEETRDTYIRNVVIYGNSKYSSAGQTVEIYRDTVFQSITTLTQSNGSWSGTAQLAGLGNAIIVKLNSTLVAYDTIYMNYYSSPMIDITTPQNNHDTSVSLINIHGISLNSESGDTIEIYVNAVLNSIITLTQENEIWLGTAQLTGIGDTITAVLHSGSETAQHSIIVNYSPAPPPYNLLYYDTYYFQNFDSLGTVSKADLPNGWRADKLTTVNKLGEWDAALTVTDYYAGNNMSSSASAGIYNFASGAASTASDRAIGWIASGTVCKSGNLYGYFINGSDSDMTGFNINYSVEKYRNGTNPAGFKIQLYYSLDGRNWFSAGDNFKTEFNADSDNNGFAEAPGATVFVSDTLPVNIRKNEALYLAWNYTVRSGSTTTYAQALSIDSVNIKGVAGFIPPEPYIKILSPAHNSETHIQNIIVFGTTQNTISGDTIFVFRNNDLIDTIILTSANQDWSATVPISQTGEKIWAQLQSYSIEYDTITVNYTILLDTQLYFNINDTLPSISAMQGAENISVLSFSLLSDTNFGTDMLQKITIKNIGNLTGDTAITNVKLYLDSDSNFKYSETDTFIDNLIWDPPYWLNTDLNYSYTLSGSNFVVAIDLSNNAAVGDTFQAMIPALSIKTQKTDTAPLTDTFASAVITVIQDTTPKIKITSPDNNYYTNLSVITISGTTLNTNAGDTIKIYTNSNLNTTVILSAMNGTWQGTAALTQTNVDTIVAVLFSNTYIRSDTIFVNYLSGSATIKILSPVTSGQRYDTSAAVITISGTTTDANNGDSIIILLNGETQSITLVSSNNWSSTTTVPVNSLQILTARFLYSGTIPVDDTIILAPGFLISGIVTLDGYQYDSGILVNLTGGISSAAAITSDTGFFRVAAISSDTYILTFSRAGYLSDAVQIFVDTDIYLGAITELKAGDYYKNGYINIRDAAILKRYYNQSNNEFDIDDNNIINYREKEYLIKNFER